MAYYLVKDIDGESVNIAVIQAENDDALIPKLLMLGVGMDADIHHIETLPFDENGMCMIYEYQEVKNG